MINKLKLDVVGNSLMLTFESKAEPSVKFSDDSNCSFELQCVSEGTYEVSINIRTFNHLSNDVFINGDKVSLDKYYLDENKFNDDFYMTETLINASARNLSPDEIFYVGLTYINKMPTNSPYLGAMITLLSYRLLDDVKNRSYLFDTINMRKQEFDAQINSQNPHSIRWFISSSSTLSMLALVLNKVDVAHDILVKLQASSHLAEFNPLSYWNYCQAMTLLGLIHIDKNQKGDAGTVFITSFIFSRNALIDIYNPRNDWLLGQLSDCTALLELGKLCLIAGTKSLDNKIPSASRVVSFDAKGKDVNLTPLFIRFKGLELNKSPFFTRVYSLFIN